MKSSIYRLKRLFNNKSKRPNRSKTGNFAITIVLISIGSFCALPMIMAINQSLKPINELYLYPPQIFVQNPTLNNFKMLFYLMSSTWVPFSKYIFNTVFVSLAGTFGHIIIASMCAYPLAKHKAPGGKFIFSIIVYSLMISAAVGDIVNYQTMQNLHWVDSYLAIIVPAFSFPLGLFIMRQFMIGIPDVLIESAKIDGASEYRIYWTLVMPNIKPAWLTASIFIFQGLWNGTNSIYIYKEQLKSLPYALSQIVSSGIIRIGPGAAVGVLMMIVPVVFFIVTQSRIVETMTTSGMKE
jgi:ABC-type glycerol-3-phosphate transport system permease component